eukprot:4348121-Prymnesium_polylepis.1
MAWRGGAVGRGVVRRRGVVRCGVDLYSLQLTGPLLPLRLQTAPSSPRSSVLVQQPTAPNEGLSRRLQEPPPGAHAAVGASSSGADAGAGAAASSVGTGASA